ncbi:unnamed protein product, partial [Heterotrigona itama]
MEQTKGRGERREVVRGGMRMAREDPSNEPSDEAKILERIGRVATALATSLKHDSSRRRHFNEVEAAAEVPRQCHYREKETRTQLADRRKPEQWLKVGLLIFRSRFRPTTTRIIILEL